ncbi:hypothetical protein OG21DRAFT_322383 [Imleria badia]|nr:hypothetical protein OG21DRAFT_322383 [Imleria badia]
MMNGDVDVDVRPRFLSRLALPGRSLTVPTPWQTRTTSYSQPGALTTSADRLVRLRQLRKAWKTLSWTQCVTVPTPGPCCAYELVGGVFCKTQPTIRRGGRGGGFGSELGGWPGLAAMVMNGFAGNGNGEEEAQEEPTHGLGSRTTMSATWLPGMHGRRGRTVVRDDLGIPTRDFAVDPSQDLMVLFKGGEEAGLPMAMVAYPGVLELHIRTMSTNQTHPETRVPVLCTPVLYPITSVFVQIVDDIVGIMYCVDPARPRITIWNWKTGHLVVDRASGNLPPCTWDFSFIHSRALFVTASDGSGSLELFTFSCDRAEGNTDSDSSPPSHPQPEPTSLTHVATLHLPPVHPSVRVLSIGTHTAPFLATCPPDTPFVSSNKERIHVLTVHYVHLPMMDRLRTRPKVCVFVHHRTLERYLQMGASQKGVASAGAVMKVPWPEWGPTHTRMLPHVEMFQWLRYVHGQRVVMVLPMSKVGKSTLRVLDFNVRRAFGDDDTNTEDEDVDPAVRKTTVERVNYPTRILMPNIFADAVESKLPYFEVRRDILGDYSGMMIDDERLVGLRVRVYSPLRCRAR